MSSTRWMRRASAAKAGGPVIGVCCVGVARALALERLGRRLAGLALDGGAGRRGLGPGEARRRRVAVARREPDERGGRERSVGIGAAQVERDALPRARRLWREAAREAE